MPAELLLAMAALVAVGTVAHAMIDPADLIAFPALASFVALGWVLPQAIAHLGNPALPEGGLALFSGMVLVSLLAIHAGWRRPHAAARWLDPPLSVNRLIFGTAALTVVGVLFSILVRRLPAEQLAASQWSGVAVAYLFFVQAQIFALALAVNLAFRFADRRTILLALVNLAFFLDAIFVYGRRAPAIQIILILVATLVLVRGWRPPRTLVLAGAVLGTLLVHSIGEIRHVAFSRDGERLTVNADRTLADYLRIDFVGNLPIHHPENAKEVENAVFTIAATQSRFDLDLGRRYWNDAVFALVPAQLVGSSLKSALMFEAADIANDVYGHTMPLGTTVTGFGDSFRAFWFFGAAVFFAIARILRRLYDEARAGGIVGQYLYALLAAEGLLAITHSTSHFLVALPVVAFFSAPVILSARRAALRRLASLPQAA